MLCLARGKRGMHPSNANVEHFTWGVGRGANSQITRKANRQFIWLAFCGLVMEVLKRFRRAQLIIVPLAVGVHR